MILFLDTELWNSKGVLFWGLGCFFKRGESYNVTKEFVVSMRIGFMTKGMKG